jgi:hypothetical protein
MSSSYITPEELIEVKRQNPDTNILSINFDKIGKAKDNDTWYLPILCKRLTGGPTSVNVKITKQVITSNAKIGFGVKPKDAKDVRVTFRKLFPEDLTDTDYPVANHLALTKFNNKFIDATDILANEYEDLVSSCVLDYDGTKFEVQSCKTVHNVRQTTRKASQEEIVADKNLPKAERQIVDKKLPFPNGIKLYRIKLAADLKNGQKIGQFTKKGHRYTVFDARKATKKNNYAPVVAKIKIKGKLTDLTTDTAKNFVTYMSLVTGVINFECVCVSSFGISFIAKFRDLHVWPHKPTVNKLVDEEDILEMATMGTSGYNSDDEVEDEPETKNGDDLDDLDDFDGEVEDEPVTNTINTKKSNRTKQSNKSKKAAKNNGDAEKYLDNEPASNDAEDEPENKTIDTKKSKKSKKSAKNTSVTEKFLDDVADEDEADEDEDEDEADADADEDEDEDEADADEDEADADEDEADVPPKMRNRTNNMKSNRKK